LTADEAAEIVNTLERYDAPLRPEVMTKLRDIARSGR
jgi:hypothetical protein